MRVLAEKTENKAVSSAEGEKALILAKAKERLAKNEDKLRKEENAKKPDLFKVVLAQAASEAVQLKTREEIPPPTNKEIGQKHGKKVMGLVRKGDWNGGGEQLKEVNAISIHDSFKAPFISGPIDKPFSNKVIYFKI